MKWWGPLALLWFGVSVGAFTREWAEDSHDGWVAAIVTGLLWPLGGLLLVGAALAWMVKKLRVPQIHRHEDLKVTMVGRARSRRIELRWTVTVGKVGVLFTRWLPEEEVPGNTTDAPSTP